MSGAEIAVMVCALIGCVFGGSVMFILSEGQTHARWRMGYSNAYVWVWAWAYNVGWRSADPKAAEHKKTERIARNRARLNNNKQEKNNVR